MEYVNTCPRIFLFWIWIQPLIRTQLQEKKLPLFNKLRGSKQTFSLPLSSLRKLPNNLDLTHTIRSNHFWSNANYFLLILIIYASAMKPRGNTFYKLLKPPTLQPVCYTTTLLMLKNTSRFTVSGWTWLRRVIFSLLRPAPFLVSQSYLSVREFPDKMYPSFETKCTIRKHWQTSYFN